MTIETPGFEGPDGRPRRNRALWGAVLMLVVAGCGNLTAGGIGEARVLVSGDAPESQQAAASASSDPAPAPSAEPASRVDDPSPGGSSPDDDSPGRSSHEDDSPEGEVEAEFRIYLVAEDGDLIELTDEEVRVRVDLEGVETPEVANRMLAADVYTGVRLVFTEIEAEVDAGLIINGEPVVGPIEVRLEDISLTVTKPITLAIRDGEVAEVLIDLNAASWLQAVDPITATVEAQVFADLVTVTIR